MIFAFDVGTDEKHRVEFARNWFSGRTTIAVDGEQLQLKSPWLIDTHFNKQFVNRYEFLVGKRETHEVTIEHARPEYFGGFFPHDYTVMVDGAVLHRHHGY
ncbi:MAG: hypothetical protein FJY92_00770 [Candidatus Hydrogenedentes bacterium]|nr:hypothetical protein [Candidatus Hydrogenedentota bacterium]